MNPYTFFIDSEDLERIKKISKEMNVSASQIIRDAIKHHLDQLGRGEK